MTPRDDLFENLERDARNIHRRAFWRMLSMLTSGVLLAATVVAGVLLGIRVVSRHATVVELPPDGPAWCEAIRVRRDVGEVRCVGSDGVERVLAYLPAPVEVRDDSARGGGK